jgi:hypothetical protein
MSNLVKKDGSISRLSHDKEEAIYGGSSQCASMEKGGRNHQGLTEPPQYGGRMRRPDTKYLRLICDETKTEVMVTRIELR